jgi:hypothetical protein
MGTTAMLGGLQWVLYYAATLTFGARHDDAPLPGDPRATAFTLYCFVVFCVALLLKDVSLMGLHARFEGRAGWRGRVALGLASLAFCSAASHLVLMLGVFGPQRIFQLFGAASVVSTCASALLLGLAGRRVPVLPRWGNTLLITTGALTMPLVILGTLSYGSLPRYVVDELPFGIAGCAWIALGVAMHQRVSPPPSSTTASR